MASSQPMIKNTATTIVFPVIDADGDLVTGAAALDSEYSLDGAGFTDCASEASEIGTSGIYSLALTAGETNGDVVCIQVKTTTTGAKTTVLVFYTAAQALDTVDTNVDTLLTRLSAARAGYLDELAAANIPADVDAILADTGTDGVVVASGSKTGYALSAAGVDDVWNEALSGHQTIGTAGEVLQAMMGNWTILNNQLLIYDLSGNLVRTFDLTRDGSATEFNPDKRVIV